mmetsp:Transcript_34829/g.75968  ORF Transcript_34829/g.75968 Transcript_34829/m.75968 type:complete len:252 (-) Transcript_34829:597-1352(-)
MAEPEDDGHAVHGGHVFPGHALRTRRIDALLCGEEEWHRLGGQPEILEETLFRQEAPVLVLVSGREGQLHTTIGEAFLKPLGNEAEALDVLACLAVSRVSRCQLLALLDVAHGHQCYRGQPAFSISAKAKWSLVYLLIAHLDLHVGIVPVLNQIEAHHQQWLAIHGLADRPRHDQRNRLRPLLQIGTALQHLQVVSEMERCCRHSPAACRGAPKLLCQSRTGQKQLQRVSRRSSGPCCDPLAPNAGWSGPR